MRASLSFFFMGTVALYRICSAGLRQIMGSTSLFYSDWFVYCLFFRLLFYHLALLLSFLDVLHCLPRAVGVLLESALNLVSLTGPCGARATHFGVLWVKITSSIFEVMELMIRAFIEVRITCSSQHNQLPAVWLCLWFVSQLLLPSKDKVTWFASVNAPSSRMGWPWLTS